MKHLNLPVTLSLFILLLVDCSNLYAIKDPIKFGKVSIEELQMKTYQKDTSAVAVYLCDYGVSDITFRNDVGFLFIYTRTLRIKILKDKGLDYGTFSFGYNKNSSHVSLTRACTYNLENGKVVKSKLSGKDKILEKTSENYYSYKFTLPNVKVGSVVEFMYQVSSDVSWSLRPWYFQKDIPVAWSEYRVSIPEYFNFKRNAKGYLPFQINEHDYSNGIAYKENYSIDNYRWVVKDAPAFKKEPYATTSKNFKSAIEFEIAGYKGFNGIYHDKTGSWKKINKILMESDDFGLQLRTGGFLKDVVTDINAKGGTNQEKMMAAFDYIKSNMKWNEYNSAFTTTTLRAAFKEKKGNVGDINLMLVVLLNKLGIHADPVILSTRNNGLLSLVSPSLGKFNYVIACCKIDNKQILLDATDSNCPCNLLPLRCINDKGRLISSAGSYFVNIGARNRYKSVTIAKLNLSEDGNVDGDLMFSYKGHAALNFRNEMKDKSTEEIQESLAKEYSNINIEELELKNMDQVEKPIQTKLQIELAEEPESGVDRIYFNPFIVGKTESNPFTLEERKYPVDYGYPIDKTFMLELTVPEGYALETTPTPVRISLPGKSGQYLYSVAQNGNKIIVTSRFKINKRQFLFNEYANLKEFYNLVVAKNAEMLVIKKTS
ncbi:DUF3857 domain-containing protein [Ancylomarina longa]|uniref:DUF3857 domain-containing protein n=1 Tax=Ancylomarina longa TaxID=2487017 RepID=A0A434AZV3_9BACT|nr:DUF3857 domain-containing protein [Ancylomarina longa]RUT80120.1 DUF3857 domain-containing protein [Ancylomarina longa]